jgi:hypothetical protein
MIDHQAGFYLIWVQDGDKWMTVLSIRYCLNEYTVMPIGLVNTPATFQDGMKTIFTDMLDWRLPIYMHDSLIYSESKEKYTKTVIEVLQQLP